MKTFTLVFISFFFTIISHSQVMVDYQTWIEENGSPDRIELPPYFNSSYESTTWNQLPNSPTAFGRTAHGAIGEYVYVFCSQNATSMALAYHIPTNTWVNSTPPNAPNFNTGFCVANGELYKLSGTTGAEKFTPTSGGAGTWTNFTVAPSVLMNAQNSMVWDKGDYIYAYSSSTSSPYPSYFYRMNLTTQVWEQRTSSLYPRRYAGMAYLDGYIYLIGGLKSDASAENVCQRYDPVSNTWSEIAPLPENVNFTKWSVDTDGRYVFLIGSGGGFSGYTVSTTFYYYDPLTNTWSVESSLPVLRGLPVGLFVPNYLKVFWGGGNDGTVGNVFQPHVWEGVGGVYIPVELTSFTANVNLNEVILNWTTASETNNARFIIERSEDGITFKDIGTIKGNGTINQQNNYYFTDVPGIGKYFYRLNQIDFNGSSNYSNVVEVDLVINDFRLFQNYPNPFNPQTNIKFQISEKSHVSLKVFDLLGNEVAELVNENKEPGIYDIEFNASSLSSGTYFYTLSTPSISETKKLIVIK